MSEADITEEKTPAEQRSSVKIVLHKPPRSKDHQTLSDINSDGETCESPEELCSVEMILRPSPKEPENVREVFERYVQQYVTKRDARGNIKVRNRMYWVIGMLAMGTSYMLLNWVNFVELSASSLHRGLLVGPPIHSVWLALLIFTAVGTITYVLESANSVSYLFSGGSTHVPLMFDVMLSILLVHIPINALNYVVATCRGSYTTTLQTVSGAFSITFIFTRMLWFAHIEGRHGEDIPERSKYIFMASCAFYAISMAFPITNWRSHSPPKFAKNDLMDTSLYLLNETLAYSKMGPELSYRIAVQYASDEFLTGRPKDPLQDFKVADLNSVANGTYNIYSTDFPCNGIYKTYLDECQNGTTIKFTFQYSKYTPDGPYGQVRYNYGILHRLTNNDSVCVPSNHSFSGTWKLYFFRRNYHYHLNGTVDFTSKFWNTDCLHPEAMYDTSAVRAC